MRAEKKYDDICPFCALDSDCSPQPVAFANKRPSQSATRTCFATLRERFHVFRLQARGTLHRAPVGQGPSGPDWLATALGFWSGRALATGTALAGLCLIHHHHVFRPGQFGNPRTTAGEEVRGRPVLWRSVPRRGVCRAWWDRALLFDFDARMCALARLFFPDKTWFGSSAFGLGAWGRWLLTLSPLCRTPIGSGFTSMQVCHATMEAKRIRAAARRSCWSTSRHSSSSYGAYRGVSRRWRGSPRTWWGEPFVATTKALFPDSVHEVIDFGRFTTEQHRRAYFVSPECDLTKLTELDGGCTVEE